MRAVQHHDFASRPSSPIERCRVVDAPYSCGSCAVARRGNAFRSGGAYSGKRSETKAAYVSHATTTIRRGEARPARRPCIPRISGPWHCFASPHLELVISGLARRRPRASARRHEHERPRCSCVSMITCRRPYVPILVGSSTHAHSSRSGARYATLRGVG